jgi:fumarylacetoacetase
MTAIDHTHDPARTSWVASAQDPATDFPLQNLPFGVIRHGEDTRVAVAIGDAVLDVAATATAGLLGVTGTRLGDALTAPDLRGVLALAPDARRALRHALHDLLHEGASRTVRTLAATYLRAGAGIALVRPWRPPDFIDCFASRHHAANVAAVVPGGRVPATFDHLPLGCHGRASSVVVGGTPVPRPFGQRRARTGHATGLSRRLDFEAELGLVVGPGHVGAVRPSSAAADHLAGVCLLNDWSARDLQALESDPLGPFLSKSFATSISPWLVTAEALAPFRAPWEAGARDVPAYLRDTDDAARGALAVTVTAWLATPGCVPVRIVANSAATLAWTPGQLLAHLASNGAGLTPGLLVGTGTISGAGPDRGGSLVELSHGGRTPLDLGGSVTRTFLEDGDEVVLRGECEAPGARRIGFGECRGVIVCGVEP